ncbi:hypothetical protein K501DRAFT_330820 [Backusella circina FSU 941]|nr:hypothetical protein K501DRAFT_330820 [Backusella circina FSU 941]
MSTKQVVNEVSKAYRSTITTNLVATSVDRLAFNQSTRRAMSAFSSMSDNDPEVIQKEKEKSMKKKEKEWSEKLASHSEAAVKADKEMDKPIEYLKKETEEYHKREKEE